MLGFDAVSENPVSALPEASTPPVPPTPVPPYSGPPLTGEPSGGGGASGGWGGSIPGQLRALADDRILERERLKLGPKFIDPTRGELAGLPPAPTTALSPVKAIAAAAVGAAIAKGVLSRSESRSETRANPTPFVAPSAPRTEWLPVAELPPPGRACWTCKVHQPWAAFAAFDTEKPGTKRVCASCRLGDIERIFTHECIVCSNPFTSGSSKALVCSDECSEKRITANRHKRRSRPPEE